MIVFPNCKINLGLHISGKREDGYHNIETVFYPVPFTDILEAVRAEQFSFSSSGLQVDGAVDNNLCVKAWKLLQQSHQIPSVSMHLHKKIPMGAGLGGGSADGAFALRLLDQLFHLGLTKEELINHALQLGSDCPFFILNSPVYATGRGEIMTPIEIPGIRGKKIIMINPGFHINTGWAFSQLALREPGPPLWETVSGPLSHWRQDLRNDFEAAVFNHHPILPEIRDRLYRAGALFAGMTGTGSTMYGLFEPDIVVPAGDFPDSYTRVETILS